jgi:hypothetical protein
VIQRERWLNIEFQQLIDKAAVEVETLLIDFASPGGEHARPTDAEAVGAETQVAHQADVLADPPVMITGDIAIRAIGDFARHMREAMPNALAGTVGQGRSFDLIGARGRAPEEILRKYRSLNHNTQILRVSRRGAEVAEYRSCRHSNSANSAPLRETALL